MDKLFEILFMKWNFLRCFIDMDDEDLCVMFYVVIYDMENVFILKNDFFYCKIVYDCE